MGVLQAPRITVADLVEIGRERVPLAALLGVEVLSVEAGRVSLRVPYRDEFVRPGGTVAGPVMMAAADFAMYGVVLSLVGRIELAVTTNLNMNFLRRPPPDAVDVHGRILKLGRRLAVGEVAVHSTRDDALVAHATCTYSIPDGAGAP